MRSVSNATPTETAIDTKNINNKFDASRNGTPGSIRPTNLYVKTPNKNINNTPIGKRSLNEDNNVSITTIRESRNYNENSYLKKLDSKKNLQNLKTKSTGKIKSVIPTGGLGHEIKNKITKKLYICIDRNIYIR